MTRTKTKSNDLDHDYDYDPQGGILLSGAKMVLKTFVKRVFTIFATCALFLGVIANLNQYNMQYIPCNSALLSQETLVLTKKSRFLPKDF